MSFRGRLTLFNCDGSERGKLTLPSATWPIRRFQGYAQPFLYHNLLVR